jgi:hypothetical protein
VIWQKRATFSEDAKCREALEGLVGMQMNAIRLIAYLAHFCGKKIL